MSEFGADRVLPAGVPVGGVEGQGVSKVPWDLEAVHGETGYRWVERGGVSVVKRTGRSDGHGHGSWKGLPKGCSPVGGGGPAGWCRRWSE